MRAFIVSALVATLLATACSSSTPSTCDSLQEFSDSLANLVNPNTLTGGRDALDDARNQVDESLNKVKESASGQFGSQVDALTEAVNKFASTIQNIGDSESISDAIGQVEDAGNEIVAAYNNLEEVAKSELSECDLSPASTVGTNQ